MPIIVEVANKINIFSKMFPLSLLFMSNKEFQGEFPQAHLNRSQRETPFRTLYVNSMGGLGMRWSCWMHWNSNRRLKRTGKGRRVYLKDILEDRVGNDGILNTEAGSEIATLPTQSPLMGRKGHGNMGNKAGLCSAIMSMTTFRVQPFCNWI